MRSSALNVRRNPGSSSVTICGFVPPMLEHSAIPSEELVDLELAVARRADELARLESRRSPAGDVSCWMRAEREVFTAPTCIDRGWWR